MWLSAPSRPAIGLEAAFKSSAVLGRHDVARPKITDATIGVNSARQADISLCLAPNGHALDNLGTCQTVGNNSLGGNTNPNTGSAYVALSQF